MNIAYFDLFAGASGDMLLASLVDAGLDLSALREALAGLTLRGWDLTSEQVFTNGLRATRVKVLIDDDVHARRYGEVAALLDSSALKPEVKQTAARILRRLAQVEAQIHDEPLDTVHLHELGGLDTLIDIVGIVTGLDLLDVEQIFVSPLPLGRGTINTRHGLLPLPAPAVAELMRDVPVRAVDVEAELVTPTGAAILTTLAHGYAAFPTMTLYHIGYGAGTRELPFPNILRVFIGSTADASYTSVESLVVLETNIDDMNPQLYDYALAKLFEAGALDVWLTPIQMKKNRAATLLSALVRPTDANALTQILFAETTTLGVRRFEVQRHALPREMMTVETPFGPVRAKVARLNGHVLRASPEYEDCRQLAKEHQVPLLEVYHAAEASIRAELGTVRD